MVAILVSDADICFNIAFKDICAALGIIYWTLACGNHKVTSVEKYYLFLKKTQEISGQDRGMHGVILQNVKTSQ